VFTFRYTAQEGQRRSPTLVRVFPGKWRWRTCCSGNLKINGGDSSVEGPNMDILNLQCCPILDLPYCQSKTLGTEPFPLLKCHVGAGIGSVNDIHSSAHGQFSRWKSAGISASQQLVWIQSHGIFWNIFLESCFVCWTMVNHIWRPHDRCFAVLTSRN
jgi:hypothetical protein